MLTIAWDVDDVLNDFMRVWFEKKWLFGHPACPLKYKDLKSNPPHKILSITLEEYLKSLDEFRSTRLYGEMKPVKEIYRWFKENGQNYRHIALSSIPYKAAAQCASWVFANFGSWIRTFHFVPSKRKNEDIPEYDRDKSGFLNWVDKVDILVDDNEDNIKAALKLGLKGILMPRPWNSQRHAKIKLL